MAHNSEFSAKYNFTYPLVCDTKARIIRAFGACKRDDCASAARHTAVVGKSGKLVHYDSAFDSDEGPRRLLRLLAEKRAETRAPRLRGVRHRVHKEEN
mmetsp:Transcript_7149/g.29719  ORF Transcript_7149/g.29719 Transcript_7149/m.29719 type:complete len:98 (-) Transcript_7149:186-479(-)